MHLEDGVFAMPDNRQRGGATFENLAAEFASDGAAAAYAVDVLNAAQTRLYRCTHEGLVRCIDMDNGKTLWEHALSFSGRLHPNGDELIVDAVTGRLLAVRDAKGKTTLWPTSPMNRVSPVRTA